MDEDIKIITQNTKIENTKIFLKKNFKKLIVFFAVSLILLFSYFGYKEIQKKKRKDLSELYNNLVLKNNSIQKDEKLNQLINLVAQKDEIYSALALYYIIDNNLLKEKSKVNKLFDDVIKMQSEKEIENLIIYKKGLYNSETSSENELLDILNPVIKSNSIWKSHALLLMSNYFASKGDALKAKSFLEEIIQIENANNDIKIEAQRKIKREFSD